VKRPDVPDERSGAVARAGTPEKKPFGFHDATNRWRLAGAGRALHAGLTPSPAPIRMVARVCWAAARITGPHLAPQRPYDFKPYSRDGLGFDWPISYEDMAPYYDKTENARRRVR